MKANATIVRLAANCGIDARGMTVQQVRDAHNKQREGSKYADQFDAMLISAIAATERTN